MHDSNSEEPKTNPQYASESETGDEPLFVLKYRRVQFIARLIPFFFIFFVLGYGAFDGPPPLFQVLAVLGFLIYVPIFVIFLFFREVRLYKDRIVRVWYFLGRRQVKLADAQMKLSTGVIGPFNRFKTICDKRANVEWGLFTGVSYNEKLADPNDVKRLNSLLAALTGRKVEEFEQGDAMIDNLIKQENK
jgi:hypothetical protein